MTLRAEDLRALRHAADVVDTQNELVELVEHRSGSLQTSWPASILVVGCAATVAIISLLTLLLALSSLATTGLVQAASQV